MMAQITCTSLLQILHQAHLPVLMMWYWPLCRADAVGAEVVGAGVVGAGVVGAGVVGGGGAAEDRVMSQSSRALDTACSIKHRELSGGGTLHCRT